MSAATLVYSDSLFAPSETFITGLIGVLAEQEPALRILTHRICQRLAVSAPVTVVPRYFPRGTARWALHGAARRLLGVELFERDLRRHLARHRYAVVHAQFGQPGYWIWRALEAAGAGRPRLIVNFYGYDATGLLVDAPEWRARYRRLFAYENLAVVVEGPVMKTRLSALGCPEEKIHVVPLCLALGASEPAGTARTNRSNDRPVFGMVGRFVEKKGFVFALRHLAPVLAAHRDVRVVIVGDGPQRGAIEALMAERGLARQITLAGMLPYAAMLNLVRGLDALLVPSLTAANGDSEGGAPTIVAEAQILGTPVIASDHADIPFSLADHAYLFKEGDDQSLVDTVKRFLVERGAAYDAAGAAARTMERHDRRAIGARYARLYAGGP